MLSAALFYVSSGDISENRRKRFVEDFTGAFLSDFTMCTGFVEHGLDSDDLVAIGLISNITGEDAKILVKLSQPTEKIERTEQVEQLQRLVSAIIGYRLKFWQGRYSNKPEMMSKLITCVEVGEKAKEIVSILTSNCGSLTPRVVEKLAGFLQVPDRGFYESPQPTSESVKPTQLPPP